MANIKKWNVCVKKTYQSQGQEKAFWPSVGQLIYFPANGQNKAGFSLDMHMFPNVKLYVFEDKPKEEKVEASAETTEISGDDVPF